MKQTSRPSSMTLIYRVYPTRTPFGAAGGSHDTKILLRDDTTALMSAGAEGTVKNNICVNTPEDFEVLYYTRYNTTHVF